MDVPRPLLPPAAILQIQNGLAISRHRERAVHILEITPPSPTGLNLADADQEHFVEACHAVTKPCVGD